MSRSLSRRGFLRLGAGAASLAVVSGLGIIGPRKAHAVVGIDDAALGGLVLLVATLGGYAFSRSVANVSLDALGYGFSDFVGDTSNQTAAVTQAIADANNLGVELNRANAESAAQSIAAGTGYFAEVMGNAATSGRVALDNFISGAGELPGVLRNLVADFISTKTSSNTNNLLPGATATELVSNGFDFDSLSVNNTGVISANNLSDMLEEYNINTDLGESGWCIHSSYYENNIYQGGAIVYGNKPIRSLEAQREGRILSIHSVTGNSFTIISINSSGIMEEPYLSTSTSIGKYPSTFSIDFEFSGSLVIGQSLPAVDRATDAPDVIGPGYDSLPLANDLVIDPSTDEVVSAGSLPLPTSIPDVFGDYVGTLNDILAGVIPGQISLPVSVAEPVVVGTAEGVQSMSITDAVAGDTSLSAAINPPVDPYPPYDPIEPPVDVPEGPWTPAVSLPFERIWPFNMIYDFVELFEQLGGS